MEASLAIATAGREWVVSPVPHDIRHGMTLRRTATARALPLGTVERVSRRRLPAALLCGLAVLAGCTSVTGAPRPDGTPTTGSPGTATAPTGATAATTASSPGGGRSTDPTAVSPPVAPQHPQPPTSGDATPTSGSPATADAGGPVTGSDGAGDPYYPTSGNGGYEVDSYDIALTYQPSSNELSATTTVKATVTTSAPLARFDLDLQPQMHVDSVQIDGATATFAQQKAELVITPRSPLAPAAAVSIVVAYHGQPGAVSGGTANLGDGGWYRTVDGGAVVAGEPYSASAWYPVNEHPSDTAAFAVTATVPDGWDVIANGVRDIADPLTAPDGMHTVRYVQREPIASYLTTIMIDKLTFTTDSYDGIPIVNAFTAAATKLGDQALATRTPQILQVLSSHFGAFPFDAYGGIYTGQSLTFALETATRPVYADWVDLDTVVHETAHQWYGDDVTIARWSDICLNECFASYAPWLYHQDVDGANLDDEWRQEMDRYRDDQSFWASPLVDMGAGREFTAVYDRGPLAVHALRHEMGEAAFAALLKGWVQTYGGRNASFDDFEAYASKLAGKDLTAFIDAWFRGTTIPAEPYRTPPGLG
jgi:aminopeptidase N